MVQIKSLEVATPVSPAKSLDEAPEVPWWVILLATLAGILILAIIILILWKVWMGRDRRKENHGGRRDVREGMRERKRKEVRDKGEEEGNEREKQKVRGNYCS